MGIISVPILRASFIQALALVFIFFLLHALWRLSGVQLTLGQAACLQGALAALLSWQRLPRWWLLIQLLLPSALLATHALALPSWIFLLAFVVLLGLYWTSFRTRVPYYPSGLLAWESVAQLLPARPLQVIDIGSGFGGLALHLAQLRPDCRCFGIEIAPLPWAVSSLRAWTRRLRSEPTASFMRGDYHSLDFGRYDIIFAYLSPAAMPVLWDKVRAQMRAGSVLLSYEFDIPGVPADFSLQVPNGRVMHGWRL